MKFNIINKPTTIGGGKQTPSMIVIHAMAEFIDFDKDTSEWAKKHYPKYANIPVGVYHAHEWLTLDGTSAHNLISPDGTIYKLRSTKKIAWHAKGHNTNSIGNEVLMKGTWKYSSFLENLKTDWVKGIQYETLAELCKEQMNFWNISLPKITTHNELSPDRKFDPGEGFNWSLFIDLLQKQI